MDRKFGLSATISVRARFDPGLTENNAAFIHIRLFRILGARACCTFRTAGGKIIRAQVLRLVDTRVHITYMRIMYIICIIESHVAAGVQEYYIVRI